MRFQSNYLEKGKSTEGVFDDLVSLSILSPDQRKEYDKKRAALGYSSKSNIAVEKSYELSDPESHALLDQE